MLDERPNTRAVLSRIWGWVRGQIVREVPEGIALCEFDCRKEQCVMGEWATCDRRQRKAAGELMPSRER